MSENKLVKRGEPITPHQIMWNLYLAMFVALGLGCRAPADVVYQRVEVDSTGVLRIVLANNSVITREKERSQVGFEQVAVSSNHQVVGWVALYPNCCTSYPVPNKLILLQATGERTDIAPDLPIWKWGFAPGGKHVVLRLAPVHGVAPTTYELREMKSGRVVKTIEAQLTRGLPEWTRPAQPNSPHITGTSKDGDVRLRQFFGTTSVWISGIDTRRAKSGSA